MPPAEATPPVVPPVDYVDRWRQIVDRRRVQMESAYERAGRRNEDYWGRRARAYRDALHQRADEDPFLQRVLRHLAPESTVLDVGAGTGRHTLALSPHVAAVTAVDPSQAMLGMLQQDLDATGAGNVRVVQGEWLQVDVPSADVVICSHVLYPIGDVVPFLRKLDAAARQRVFVYLRVDALPTDMGLWPEFHGEALQSQPTHLDLFGVLAQMGIAADVEVVEHRFTWTFAALDEAVAQVGNSLCLRDDDASAMDKLRALLEERLVRWPNGRFGPEVHSARSAIFTWAPDATPTS